MKFKGKKAIMAAALSTIVAAGSFSTVAFADTSDPITIKTSHIIIGDAGYKSCRIVDKSGNDVDRANPILGETYTIIVYPNENTVVTDIIIDGVLNVQPNATSTYSQTFVMPGHGITVVTKYKKSDSNTNTDPTPTWKKGDADCNGTVNTADATAVLKHIVGITMLSDQGFKNADMDDNGQITTADATAILKLIISKP